MPRMRFLGTQHITTTSFHPQINGIIDRRLKDALRMQPRASAEKFLGVRTTKKRSK